jgi:hypothetical protein
LKKWIKLKKEFLKKEFVQKKKTRVGEMRKEGHTSWRQHAYLVRRAENRPDLQRCWLASQTELHKQPSEVWAGLWILRRALKQEIDRKYVALLSSSVKVAAGSITGGVKQSPREGAVVPEGDE